MNVSLDEFSYKKKPSVLLIADSDDEDEEVGFAERIEIIDDSSNDSMALNSKKRKRAKINSHSDDEFVTHERTQKRICISDDEDDDDCQVIPDDDGDNHVVDDDGNNGDNTNNITLNHSLDSSFESPDFIDNKKKLLTFLDSCTLDELKSVPKVSKKAESIFSMKPFESWEDMVQKIDEMKNITFLTFYESCIEYLEAVESVENIMKQCNTISEKFQQLTRNSAKVTIEQPSIIANGLQLKHYQLVGLNWLATLFENNCSGILADQMGLGKTIQTLAFIGHLVESGHDGPHLIICPCSTLDNWVRECDKWLPDIQYAVYSGSQVERSNLRNNLKNTNSNAVIISTYNMVLSTKKDRKFFKNLQIQCLILDEAHMVKNMKSERYQQLMQLTTSIKLLLTGTPLQNDVIELVSLLTFLMPDVFLQHQDKINKLITRQNQSQESEHAKSHLEKIKKLLNPFILRRLKSDVLSDMPNKHESLCLCELDELQKEYYQETITSYRKNLTAADSGMTLLISLRKIANHPLLLRKVFTDEKISEMSEKYCASPFHSDCDVNTVYEDMSYMSDFELHSFCKNEKILRTYQLDENIICNCTKLKELDKLLPSLKRKGSRVLLFSQFVIVLDIVQEYLKIRNHSFLRFDGSVKSEIRQSLVDEYNQNDDIFIFLLSTKAGGLGINLTSANTVIFHDIDYNPYNDQQAEDRCHRIGQTREVTIYKLIAKDTIEEDMLRIGENKLRLGKTVIGDNSTIECQKDLTQLMSTVLRNV